jgi:c-di-GMP-binding flagellar brake protein YcgR
MLLQPRTSFERRNAFRIVIPATMNLAPLIVDCEAGFQRARLVDISRCGASALLHGRVETPTGSIALCIISLFGQRLLTDAEIRSSITHCGHLRLGLMFPDLKPEQQKHLDTSIATLQRNLLRDYPHSLIS